MTGIKPAVLALSQSMTPNFKRAPKSDLDTFVKLPSRRLNNKLLCFPSHRTLANFIGRPLI